MSAPRPGQPGPNPEGTSIAPWWRSADVRLIGYSPGAGFVLTVIIDPLDSSGVTAWKTRGTDLRAYLEQRDPTDD